VLRQEQEQVSLTSWVVQLQVRRREIMNQEGAMSKKYVCRVNKRVQHAIRRMDDGGVLRRATERPEPHLSPVKGDEMTGCQT